MAYTLTATRVTGWPYIGRFILLLGMAGLLGLFGGVLSASGRPELTAIFLGLVVAALIMTSRVAVFWFVVIGALVVAGAAQLYLPGSRHIRYVVPLASLALLLHWVTDYFAARGRTTSESSPGPLAWALGFALVGLASMLMNLSDPGVAIMGSKNYFQMWGLFLGVALLRWHASFGKQLLWGLVLIALLQLPFAAHQYLYLVPQRVGLGGGIVPVDIVAGTFGATLFGGGANAVLAAFQIVIVGWLLALWKNGSMSAVTAFVGSLLLLSPLLVIQAKVAVLYLPLMFLVLFYREIAVRPLRFLLVGAGMAGMVAALMTALILTNPMGRFETWSDLVEWVVARQTAGIEERQDQYNQLSRVTALTFWAEQHVTANPAHTLLGHGLGASREPEGGMDVAPTLAQQRYAGLGIGHTAIAALLWETGLIGTLLVLGMFASAFLTAGRLARYYRGQDKFRTAMFEGLQAAMAVLTLSLVHKDFFVVHLPYQAFVYLLIGFIAYSRLQLDRGEGARHVQGRV
jgi:hypothetical protein